MSRTASSLEADPIEIPEDQDPIWRLLDREMPWATRGKPFSVNFLAAGPTVGEGWKVHVSATPWSAGEVLERALPLVLDAGISCKVVNTRLRLMLLNNGAFGAPQAGKFLTLYPGDDAQAVEIALALDEATAGLPGPRIATDRPLRPRSLVHYRYGAFGSRPLHDAAGRLLADRRRFDFVPPPPGVLDPFEAASAYLPAPARKPPLGGRYLIAGVLSRSPCGGVYRALDVGASPPRMCVLKEYWRDAGGDLEGRLAPTWGEAEADLLVRHSGDECFPEYFGRFELEGNLFVALEYVDGRPLAAEIEERRLRGTGFSIPELVRIGAGAARALAHLHRLGVIYRDCNPANLLRTPSGGQRLIDFGIAHEQGVGDAVPRGLGTLDYCSPQQWEGGAPSPADDVFSWGAVMHRLLCAPARPEVSGDGPNGSRRPLERDPVAALRPELPPAVAAVIDRALAWEAAERYASMVECGAAFERATQGVGAAAGPTVTAREPARGGDLTFTDDPLALAREVGEALSKSAIERDGGVCWPSGRGGSEAFCGPDLYHGAAGIALFLAELGSAGEDQRFLDVAEASARWIAGSAWAPGRAEPGLHCGESGAGWFFLRLAELTGKSGYLTAAELRARRLRGVHLASLDLNEGAAGQLLFLVRLARATSNPAYLDEALALAEVLIDEARPSPAGSPGCHWPAPTRAGTPGLSLLGLAHGSAGIALALAEFAAATGHERALATVRGVAELLLAEAQPHPDGGWRWREGLDDDPMRIQGQCHGAIGVGQFFLRLARLDPRPSYLEAGAEAAVTAARELPHRTAVGICHGLAGDGYLLLECAEALETPRFRRDAAECAARLRRFRDPDRPGSYVSPATGSSPPDLLTGDAAVGSFYLRLAAVGPPPRDPVLA